MQNHYETLLDLVNNKPLPVEKADVSLKGRVNAMPLLVTYCTNYEQCNLSKHCMDPIPFWRRLAFHVEVKVKKEFALANGSLDSDKASAAASWDLWELRVRRFTPSLI